MCFSCSWELGCFTHYTAAVGAFGVCARYMAYCEVERGVLAAANVKYSRLKTAKVTESVCV